MIYTPLTCKAMQIAYQAHHGQVDRAGIPYIFHPIHLAEQMRDEYTTCIALLHDVAEDTDITLDELAEVFPQEIIRALELLTHKPGVDYFCYVAAIRENPLAKAVKLADLQHNSDKTRLPNTPENEALLRRLEEKYTKAFQILTQ